MNHQKRYAAVKLLTLALVSITSMGQSTFGYTFFRPRPLSQNSALELGIHRYDMQYNAHESSWCPWLNLQLTPFYYKSTNESCLAGYFLPRCKQCITIEQNNTSDVSSPWLGLFSDPVTDPLAYSSVMCLCPRRSVAGGALRLVIKGESFLEGCWSHAWGSVFIPFAQVRHSLNITDRLTGSPGVAEIQNNIVLRNALIALNNPNWDYGTFPLCTQTKTGPDDAEVKLGWDFGNSGYSNTGVYAVFFIPTGHASRARTVFEPTLGAGDHAGVGFGLYGDYMFWEGCATESSLTVLADVKFAYFLRGTEVRSFDLTNSAFSRYMLFANEVSPQISFPAINFLTFPVKVTPRGAIDAWFALHYNRCDWNFEIGYDFWWRQQEEICITCDPFVQQVSIFDLSPAETQVSQTSMSTATISQGVVGLPDAPVKDAEFTPLTLANLRCLSGATPRTMTSTVYGGFSWNVGWWDYCGLIGVAGSYEHAHNRGALSQWGVWLTTNITF